MGEPQKSEANDEIVILGEMTTANMRVHHPAFSMQGRHWKSFVPLALIQSGHVGKVEFKVVLDDLNGFSSVVQTFKIPDRRVYC